MLYLNELPRPPKQFNNDFDERVKRHRRHNRRRSQVPSLLLASKAVNAATFTATRDAANRIRPPRPYRTSLGRLLLPYFKEYCDTSTVHGIRYLTDPKLQYFERVIWLFLLLATSACAIYIYIDLSALYQSDRIHTTIDSTVYPVFLVPFPSIGLCPRNRIDWPKLVNEAPSFFLGANVSDLHREVFIAFFGALGDVHLNRLNSLANVFENSTISAQLGVLNNLNVAEVLRHVMLTCKDIFTSYCQWRNKPYNCCDLFNLEKTEAGFCYVFNSAVSPALQERKRRDKYYPYHNPSFGEGMGLDIVMQLNKSKIRPNFNGTRGVYVMVKQPEQWHDDVRLVPHDTYTKIYVLPRLTTTDGRARAVSPDLRGCLFSDETESPIYKKIDGLRYWRGNCRTRCHQDHVHVQCNCSPSVLFPTSAHDNYTDCTPIDYKCLYDKRNIFRVERHLNEEEYIEDVDDSSMTCNCLNNCEQLVFDKTQTSAPISVEETNSVLGSIHLDIFHHSQYIIKYNTRMRFTYVELLANFGGIIGLFLGASLLSGVELIYYMTIGLYFYLHGNWQLHSQRPSEKPEDKHKHKIAFINQISQN